MGTPIPSCVESEALANLNLIGVHSSQVMFEQPGGKQIRYDLAPADNKTILPLPNMPHHERSLLDVPGTRISHRFVTAQCGLKRDPLADVFGQHQRVFQSHTSALPQIGCARMRCITKQGDQSIAPAS